MKEGTSGMKEKCCAARAAPASRTGLGQRQAWYVPGGSVVPQLAIEVVALARFSESCQMLTSHTHHANAKEDRMCGGPLTWKKGCDWHLFSFSGPRSRPCGLPQARYPASIT